MDRSNRSKLDAGGNTKPQHQDSPAKGWFFTLKSENTPHSALLKVIDPLSDRFAFQQEKGVKRGYPHYQGMFHLKSKMRFGPLKSLLPPEIHLEKLIDEKSALEYCTKSDTQIDGPWVKGFSIPRQMKLDLYPWEKEIEEIVTGPEIHRKVYWYYNIKGGCGKTTFCEYLRKKYDYILHVKARTTMNILIGVDIRYKVYLIDIPMNATDFDPYDAIEDIKDGYVWDTKCKGVPRIVEWDEKPHVIVFANRHPDLTKLSEDRWVIKRID